MLLKTFILENTYGRVNFSVRLYLCVRIERLVSRVQTRVSRENALKENTKQEQRKHGCQLLKTILLL